MRTKIKHWIKLLLCKILGHDYVLDVKQYYISDSIVHNSFDGESVYCKTCGQEGKVDMRTGKIIADKEK